MIFIEYKSSAICRTCGNDQIKNYEPYSAKFEYPYDQIRLILHNSYKENEFYAVDEFESKKLKIILAKYGCRRCFHTLPGHLHANLFPFVWDKLKQCYRADMKNPVSVQLNILEEAVVNHHVVS